MMWKVDAKVVVNDRQGVYQIHRLFPNGAQLTNGRKLVEGGRVFQFEELTVYNPAAPKWCVKPLD